MENNNKINFKRNGRCSPKFLGVPVSESSGAPVQNADSCQHLATPQVRIQVILVDSDSLWHTEIWEENTWLWWRCCWGLRLISSCFYMSSCRRGVQAQPLSVGYCEQEFEQIWASNPGTKEGAGPRRVMVGPGSHCFPAGGRSPLPTCHCLERTGWCCAGVQ